MVVADKKQYYELLNWNPGKPNHLTKVLCAPDFPGMYEAVAYIKRLGTAYTTVKEICGVNEFLFYVPKMSRKFVIQKM